MLKLKLIPDLPLTTSKLVTGDLGRRDYTIDLTKLLENSETTSPNSAFLDAKVAVVSSDPATVEVVDSQANAAVTEGIAIGKAVEMRLQVKRENARGKLGLFVEFIGNSGTIVRWPFDVELKGNNG